MVCINKEFWEKQREEYDTQVLRRISYDLGMEHEDVKRIFYLPEKEARKYGELDNQVRREIVERYNFHPVGEANKREAINRMKLHIWKVSGGGNEMIFRKAA